MPRRVRKVVFVAFCSKKVHLDLFMRDGGVVVRTFKMDALRHGY